MKLISFSAAVLVVVGAVNAEKTTLKLAQNQLADIKPVGHELVQKLTP
jgi:hypothetical protein